MVYGNPTCNDWNRDKVDQETKLEETTEKNDETREEAEENRVLGSVLSMDTCHQSHDCGGANCDVFAASKYTVNKTSHKCRV